MLFEVFTGEIAITVIAISGVPIAGWFFGQSVDKHHGVTPSGGLHALIQQCSNVLIVVIKSVLDAFCGAGDITVLRQDDQIDGIVQCVQLLKLVGKVFVAEGNIVGIGWLNDTGFHINAPILSLYDSFGCDYR